MRKLLVMLMSVALLTACGKDDKAANTAANNLNNNTANAANSGLFSQQATAVSDPSSLIGLWETNSFSQYDNGVNFDFLMRFKITGNSVSVTLRCQAKGITTYASVISPAEQLANGDIRILENKEATEVNNDLTCTARMNTAVLKVSDIQNGRMVDGTTTLTKIAD